LIVSLENESGRFCRIHDIAAGATYTGKQLLDAAIALCEAAGYRVQGLEDASKFPVGGKDHKVGGKHLGLLHRGWTWYMRNGFLPVYTKEIYAPLSVLASRGGKVEEGMVQYFVSRLKVWCDRVKEAREHFGDLTGKDVSDEAVTTHLHRHSEMTGIIEKKGLLSVQFAYGQRWSWRVSDLPGAVLDLTEGPPGGKGAMASAVRALLTSAAGCPGVV